AGLLFVQYLRSGAGFDGPLLVSEPSATKRALATRVGADPVDPTSAGLVGAVADPAQGRSVERMSRAPGAGGRVRTRPGTTRTQSTILLYGHGHAGVDMSVMNFVQFLEPTLVSPVGASGGHDADGRPLVYQKALRLLEQGAIDVRPLVTHRYTSLDAVPGA